MHQRPEPSDPARQQGGVLIFRRHDDAVALEGLEIFCHGQRHAGPPSGKGSISDRILLQLRHVSDARIFYAPEFFGVFARIGRQRRLRINAPAIDSIRGSGRAKVRQATPIFDATQQQRVSVVQTNDTGVEDAVDRIGPVLAAENRVGGMAEEERVLAVKSGVFGVVLGRIGQRGRQGDCAQTDTLVSCFCCGEV